MRTRQLTMLQQQERPRPDSFNRGEARATPSARKARAALSIRRVKANGPMTVSTCASGWPSRGGMAWVLIQGRSGSRATVGPRDRWTKGSALWVGNDAQYLGG